MRRLLRPQYRLLLPIQWHHPAQHALQIDRHIGIGEQIVRNRRGQQRQSQQAPGLRYIDAFGSGNFSDRPKLAFIEQPGVSEAKLLELVTRLGHDVKIVVSPVRRRAGKIELHFA